MSERHTAPDHSAQPSRALLVIPVFNNRATLRHAVKEALTTGLEVLVANDGSTDGGPETLEGLPIHRLDLPVNQGKGAAILAAAKWAEEHFFTHLITVDADGQHDPREAALFLKKIRLKPWSIIVGARNLARAKAPGMSRFGRHFSNFWLKAATGVSLPDSQSGFRAYPVAALRGIRCSGRRYDYEAEILVRGAWAGLSLESVDISVRYGGQEPQISHFNRFWDNLRISRIYARSVIRNFIPWPHKLLDPARLNPDERLSLRHPLRSLKILIHESSSPREIAAASMLGIFLGTLPLIACHSVVIVFCATRLRLNRLIAFNVSHLCAAPFVPALAIEVGYFARHGRFLTQFNLQTLGREAPQRLLDYLLGALIAGPALAVVAGIIAYLIALFYQKKIFNKSAQDLG